MRTTLVETPRDCSTGDVVKYVEAHHGHSPRLKALVGWFGTVIDDMRPVRDRVCVVFWRDNTFAHWWVSPRWLRTYERQRVDA